MFEFRTRMTRQKPPGRCRGKANGAEIWNVEYRSAGGKWKLHSQYISKASADQCRNALKKDASFKGS